MPFSIASLLVFSGTCRDNGVLSVFWYVTGKQRDIADFAVVIRHIGTGEIIYETMVGYNKRSFNVRQDRLRESAENMQLCIIAKRSNHELGLFLESQCVRVSDALRASEKRNFYSTEAQSSSSRLLSEKKKVLLMHFLCILFWVFRK